MVQQIIRDIHETLRTIVKNNTDLFQENGNLTNCSIQLHPTKDKVLNIRYYLLLAVFQIHLINRDPQMRFQFQSVVDEYLQQIVGDDQLREDCKGKVWRYFIGREPDPPQTSTTSTTGGDKQSYEDVSSEDGS